jgi:predicted PolB exonuclease-like 3'-5' exonuclease
MNNLQHLLFLDIETVSSLRNFETLDERGRKLWQQKIGYMARRDDHEWTEDEYACSYSEKAAIYAEFGKVIVISAGIIGQADASGPALRIKSFYGHDEKEVLSAFSQVIDKNFNDPNLHVLCGHNIREFDIPYLSRRMTINEVPLPVLFNIHGKKPWEVKYIADTLELWKFGDHKNFTSLDLLAYSLGIPSPKDSMDGSKVGQAYWEENLLEQIKSYCERDVITVAQVYLKLNQLPLLEDQQIVITN